MNVLIFFVTKMSVQQNCLMVLVDNLSFFAGKFKAKINTYFLFWKTFIFLMIYIS